MRAGIWGKADKTFIDLVATGDESILIALIKRAR